MMAVILNNVIKYHWVTVYWIPRVCVMDDVSLMNIIHCSVFSFTSWELDQLIHTLHMITSNRRPFILLYFQTAV